MIILIRATCVVVVKTSYLGFGKNIVCGEPTVGVVPCLMRNSMCQRHLDEVKTRHGLKEFKVETSNEAVGIKK